MGGTGEGEEEASLMRGTWEERRWGRSVFWRCGGGGSSEISPFRSNFFLHL